MCQNIFKIQFLKIFTVTIYLLFLPLICLTEEIVKHCNSDDLIFQFTPCDQNDKRWLFAVPRSHDFLCTPESVPAPLHGLNCSVTCPAGHFLEMNSQKCKLCKPGTFSLGDRVRYEEFELTKLPEGFSIENSPDESFGGRTIKCGGGGWSIEGNQLRYSWTPCVSTLSISLHLTRPGFAEFQYQVSRESKGLIQMLQVRNAQCQSYGNSKSLLLSQQKHLNKENNNEKVNQQEGADIRVQRLSLRRGQNLITWTVAVNPVLSSRMEMIRIIRIDISGLAFAPECSSCPEGTFSSVHGAQHCEPCGENEFAQKEATQCQQCPPNMWAEPRSEFCQKRPFCSSLDYFPVRPSICVNSSEENLKMFWRKLNPQICIDNGILNTLPNKKEKCLPCGPEMERNNAGYCENCPKGFISSGEGKCSPCPSGSIPNYGIFLTNWDSLPPGIELKKECEFLSAEIPNECPVNPSWISYGNRLESATTRMRGVALEINIKFKDGFSSFLHTGKITNENPLGKISMEVSLQCKGKCQFYIVQKIEKENSQQFIFPEKEENLQLLKMLTGSFTNNLLVFPILNSFPIHLLIAFTRTNAILGKDEINDKAIIHSINITNNGDITNNFCIKCPIYENGKCKPCPSGEYFDKKKCTRCPPNTVLNQTESIYLLSNINLNNSNKIPCSKCPKYFQNSEDGLSCEFSGKFELEEEDGINSKINFDLSLLKGIPLSAKGIKIFARDGQSFTHIFNFSLFPNYPIKCKDSIPTKRQINIEEEEEENNALFCRSAVVPIFGKETNKSEEGEEFVYISSTIISNKLVMISKQREYGGFKLSDEQLEYELTQPNTKSQRPLDIHFFFESTNILIECPNGTMAAVTVRCDPSIVTKPLVRLSRHCPDGTCDGCLYHAIVESALACPVCNEKDFKTIRGECINDIQKVHTIPSKHCVISGAQSHEREEPCRTILSSNLRLILSLTIILILILLLIICAIYRRNKTLEYRYMRLIEGKEMDNSARSCALNNSDQEDSEEENNEGEEIIKSSKARVFFSNKKSKKNKEKYGKLDERTEFIVEEESD
uniref:MRH domain-containing protein n=1 Tax=Meloidogyne enterolobii TaxID=390850 RepID=A0A6V7TKR0_MELEN|nr:unnamed protein product [Meloidogyne enterolobii]